MATKKKVGDLSAGDVVVLHGVPVLLSASERCPSCAPNRVIGEEARAGFHAEHNYASVSYAKDALGKTEGPEGDVSVTDALGR